MYSAFLGQMKWQAWPKLTHLVVGRSHETVDPHQLEFAY